MRTSWLLGVSAGALLALTFPGATASAQNANAPASIEGVPVPQAAELPPPTAADIAPRVEAAATSRFDAGGEDAPARLELRGTEASRAESPASSPADGSASPEMPATTASVANPAGERPDTKLPVPPDSALDEATILRAVPVPEPANVPPPTLSDVGAIPLAPADAAVAEKLRDIVTGKIDRWVEGKPERSALQAFYKERNYAPLWVEGGSPSAAMRAAIARLKAADSDGLDATAYPGPDLASLGSEPEALAQAELKLLNSVLLFAKHAQSGRVTPSRISVNIDVNPPVPEPAAILAVLKDAKDVTAALDGFNPPHEGFQALKAKLADLRGRPEEQTVEIPSGPTLKRGMRDRRIPLLRERLKIEGNPEDTTFDRGLSEAVKQFQLARGLKATGTLNQATVDALNGRSHGKEVDTIVSNMERWRWLPRELGQAYVMVNIPDFTLKAVNEGKTVFHTRIVVGQKHTPSPVFSDEIENIVVNPSWHVPQSIIYGEYLPALEQDPSVLARMGLIVSRNRDGSISVRQPPGERNALGRLKFNFPNKFQVYLHDTPQKHLFAHDKRAYSHGCMRVQNPAQFAEVLLSLALPQERYTADRISRMFGRDETTLKFKSFIPVHLVYMNTYVDDHGKLVIRDDVYGYDKRVQSALRGEYVVVYERSQKVTPGARSSGGRRRTMASRQPQQPVYQQQRNFFFPFFQ